MVMWGYRSHQTPPRPILHEEFNEFPNATLEKHNHYLDSHIIISIHIPFYEIILSDIRFVSHYMYI
jgi:hypothetical protein